MIHSYLRPNGSSRSFLRSGRGVYTESELGGGPPPYDRYASALAAGLGQGPSLRWASRLMVRRAWPRFYWRSELHRRREGGV